MRFVIQRVNHASVTVNNNITGAIEKGLLIFMGVSQYDTCDMLQKYVDKIIKLRIFSDENGKTNLSVKDVGGSLLVISQFTLYADCLKGNRPSFTDAGAPEDANSFYKTFISLCRQQVSKVESGIFGADMKVSLENDGPFTIILDSNDF